MASKHEIKVYDFLLYEETYRKNVPFIYGDVRDYNRLKKYLQWAEVIIWLTALVGDPACSLNEQLTRQINIESVQFLREHFKGKIIFLSTCSVYGAADEELDEKSGLNPLSLYARTKVECENILANTNALMFRLGTLYGISDSYSRIRFDLVVNTLVMRSVIHGNINIFGGEQFRPHLHVRDAAAMICACLDNKHQGIYNLASENMSIMELAGRIKNFFPLLKIITEDSMFQDNRNYRVTSAKAIRELGFKPRFNIEDGIKELKNLLEEGRVKNSFINRFSNYLYLKPLLEEYNWPLGKVVKQNI